MTRTAARPVPADLYAVLAAYRTCELATMTRAGVPIAWPAATQYRPETGTFLVTTSIALAQKAINVRRDPRVCLLFSDPTGSGLVDPPQIQVTGTATCPDRVVTSPEGLEAYWARLYELQPASRAYAASAPMRWAFDWYYMRLIITITPTAVERRPPLVAGPAPARLRAGRRGGVGGDAYRDVARRLPEYRSAVLATADGEGPRLQRVDAVPDGSTGSIVLHGADASALRAGGASLLCHRHNEQLWDLRSFAAMGDLDRDGDGTWRLTPTRFVPGGDRVGPVKSARAVRRLRAAARRYLDARDLPRPGIPWQAYEDVKAGALGAAGRSGSRALADGSHTVAGS